MLRSLSAVCAALVLALVAASCGGDDGADAGGENGEAFKVGFMYIGPPGDAGWTFQHDEARKFVEEELGDERRDDVPRQRPGGELGPGHRPAHLAGRTS